MTVDSLRRDAVDRSPQTHTPTLRRLADRGTWVANATAQGNWTPFSFPSILGGRPVFTDRPSIGVGSSPTLAETLSAAGFETAGFNAANGFLTDHWGYDRGFDTFESFMPDADGPFSRWLTTHPTVKAWLQFASHPVRTAGRRLLGGEPPDPENVSRLRDVEQAAIDFLDGVDGPFFCWVHLMDTHTPYVPAPKHVRAVSAGDLGSAGTVRAHLKAGLGRAVSDRTLDALRTLYFAAARQTDAAIGRILAALDTLGLREQTAVVVAGDHGEEFQEHGHLAHYPKLYRELVDVPLLLDLPGDNRERIETPVGLDSIPATLCDACGVSLPSQFTGQSLLEPVATDPVTSLAVRGESVTAQPIPRSPAEGEVLVSARTSDWTYIQHTDSGREELYDRRDDPGEQQDTLAVATDGGARRDAPLARLQAAAKHRLQTLRSDDSRPETPEELTDQLAALGYR